MSIRPTPHFKAAGGGFTPNLVFATQRSNAEANASADFLNRAETQFPDNPTIDTSNTVDAVIT